MRPARKPITAEERRAAVARYALATLLAGQLAGPTGRRAKLRDGGG